MKKNPTHPKSKPSPRTTLLGSTPGPIPTNTRRGRAASKPTAMAGKCLTAPTPILTMKAIPNKWADNVHGYERIHFLAYNYDGNGTALVRFDDQRDLHAFGGLDLIHILLGDPGSGDRWYRLE